LRIALILAASFAACLPLPALAGEVAGTVYDARGLPAAGVALDLAGQHAVSDTAGAFAFADVPAGDLALTTGNQAVRVAVPAQGSVRRNVMLLSRTARTRVTGEVATPADNAQMLAATAQLAQAILDEGAARPARRVADIGG